LLALVSCLWLLFGSRYSLLSFAFSSCLAFAFHFGSLLVLASHFYLSFTSFVYCFYLSLLAMTRLSLFTLIFLLTLIIYGFALAGGSNLIQAPTLNLAIVTCFIY